MDLGPFDPKEKCRRKKGFPKELLLLELESFLGHLPLKPSNTTESSSISLSTIRFFDLLFLAFKSISAFRAFADNFIVCFSPKVQTGQAGSYLLISDVILSKHSA
ncbi:hypothetical protein V8G54_006045 [Vigna mungo]|uniref:Uncharacterized protein n=1 Tax=Vigna mungo TaxID=3915 RepID=A0AAQ3S6Y3_VIGMU